MKNRKRKTENASSGYVFMHIPKTGGSSIGSSLDAMRDGGFAVPGKLKHKFTLRTIRETYPGVKVCFLLRDPVERASSGFLSGMRSGRPTYQGGIWAPAAAPVFAFFDSPARLLKALASDDERLKSAAYYAFSKIGHLQRNYVHYFESVDQVEKNLSSIGVVGEISRFNDFLAAMMKRVDPSLGDISPYIQVRHVAKQTSAGILDTFTETEKQRIRVYFAEDYKIYDRLCQLINC